MRDRDKFEMEVCLDFTLFDLLNELMFAIYLENKIAVEYS